MITPNNRKPTQPVERAAFSVKDMLVRYGVSRTKFYQLVESGDIRLTKLGHRSLIMAEDDRRFCERLAQGLVG